MTVIVSAFPVYAATTTSPASVEVAESPRVIITEFQTNGGAAAQEFIELYNNTDQDIIFGGANDEGASDNPAESWKLQFFNSTAAKAGAPNWSTTLTTNNSIELTGSISAHDYFLIASTNYKPANTEPDMVYSASSSHLMADTGGGLQLLSVNPQTNVLSAHDRVLWLAKSSTALPEGVLQSPASGKSLQRVPNDNNEYLNEDETLEPFAVEDVVTPLEPWLAPEPVQEADPTAVVGDMTNEGGTEANSVAIANEGLASPTITELLPNPASPLTDADDEFIELYNSNEAAFDLEGYKLEVGTTTLRTYTFPSGTVLDPLGYKAFYSADTKLSLSNSGSQVRLRDPNGGLLFETAAYGTAKDGQAWVSVDGIWQWTTSATPGLANILAVPVVATKATATKTKAATTKKAAAAKTTKAKTTKAKAAKKATKKKASAVKTAASIIPEKAKPPIHTGILVAVVSVAVLYGLYEYRHDLALKIRQLTRNRGNGRADRLAPARR